MEFLSEYGLFFAKVITIVIAIIIVIGAMAAQAMKNKSVGSVHGHIEVKNINNLFKDFEHQMKDVVLSHEAFKADEKEQK